MKRLLALFIILFTSICLAKTIHTITIRCPTEIMTPWYNIESTLKHATGQTIKFLWEGDGGDMEYGLDFIHILTKAQKKNNISFTVTGPSISMHSLILCYANDVKMNPRSVLIFHAPSRPSVHGKVYNPAYIHDFDPCIQKGYLTKHEVDLMFYHAQRVEYYPDGHKKILHDWLDTGEQLAYRFSWWIEFQDVPILR